MTSKETISCTISSFFLLPKLKKLPEKIQKMIMYGNDGELLSVDTTNSKFSHGSAYRSAWEGIVPSLERRYRETGSEDMKEYYGQYMTVHPCTVCSGARLNKESLSVTVGNLNIFEITCLPIRKCKAYLESVSFGTQQTAISLSLIHI